MLSHVDSYWLFYYYHALGSDSLFVPTEVLSLLADKCFHATVSFGRMIVSVHMFVLVWLCEASVPICTVDKASPSPKTAVRPR